MELRLRFKLSPTKFATDSRETFWQEYCRQANLPFSGEGYERGPYEGPGSEGPYSADRLEAIVRNRLIAELNDRIFGRFGRDFDYPSRSISDRAAPFANVVLTLQRFEYNSLEMVLKVLGLDDGTLLPVLAGILEVYAPDAFSDAMPGHEVALRASAAVDPSEVIGMNRRTDIPPPSNSITSRNDITRTILWGALNGSLLVPVVLALLVVYQALGSLNSERDAISKDGELITRERTAILQTLTQQNSWLIRALLDQRATTSREEHKDTASQH